MKTFPSILAVSGFVLAASVQTATAGVATPLTTTRVASGLTLPVFVTAPRADFNRLFIVEQRASAGIANRADIKILNIAVNPPVLSGVPFFTIVGVNTGNAFPGVAVGPGRRITAPRRQPWSSGRDSNRALRGPACCRSVISPCGDAHPREGLAVPAILWSSI